MSLFFVVVVSYLNLDVFQGRRAKTEKAAEIERIKPESEKGEASASKSIEEKKKERKSKDST